MASGVGDGDHQWDGPEVAIGIADINIHGLTVS